MTRSLLTILVLALFWSPAQAARAQKPTLDSRIDVRVETMPAADAFRQIINGLGYELQMDASIDAPVTLWVTHVSARTALNVLCESLGCQWRINGTRLVVSQPGMTVAASGSGLTYVGVAKRTDAGKAKVVANDLLASLRKPLPVDMQFTDVPVSTVLRAMSQVSGLEITADEPLASKHVTLTGSGKTVESALTAVVKQAGGGGAMIFTVRDTGAASTPTIRIAIRARDVKK
jgi:hypothetical protein